MANVASAAGGNSDRRKRWHLTGQRKLRLWDRLRVLFGAPLFIRFESPNGQCHAACGISVRVQRDWPTDDERWS